MIKILDLLPFADDKEAVPMNALYCEHFLVLENAKFDESIQKQTKPFVIKMLITIIESQMRLLYLEANILIRSRSPSSAEF